MSADRKSRVGDAIRDALSEMIRREVKDPRVTSAGVITITRVEMNVDMQVANVYVSIYGEDNVAERAIAGLVASAGFLRGPLGRRLRLGRPPELRFIRDTGVEFGMELTRIVRDDEARARAAGRDPNADTVRTAPAPDDGTLPEGRDPRTETVRTARLPDDALDDADEADDADDDDDD